jgi:hypothetical protein
MMRSILQLLSDKHIFSIEKQKNGMFEFYEECDGAYSTVLTGEEVIQLAGELVLLAEASEPTGVAIMEPAQQTQQHPQPQLLDRYFLPRIVDLLLDKNIRLQLAGCKTHLSQAGIMSLVGLIYGDGYFGRFSPDGWFTPNKTCKLEYIQQLQDVQEHGLEAAKRIGMLTGRCCICARTLTAEDSVEAGIGPICASKAFGG